jgi:hypothetical protein
MKTFAVAALVAATLALGADAEAAPRHDICADVGDSFTFGVSSYGALREWAPEARSEYGAEFEFLYVYILADGMEDPQNFEEWYVRPFAEAAIDMDAIPVFTFYQLLDLGRGAGYSGSEAEVVQQAIADPGVMNTYFEHFVWLLEIAQSYDPPVIVHVEPDSWGFMMWAMGIEGNDDATSVPVAVESSGHPDLGGFSNHAGGLGQALLALRDQYAPDVRLGWHASNFRVGTRPEVVTSFYASMGDWDVLIGEHQHFEADEAAWWDDWDPDRLETNLTWLSTVVEGAGVPLILWQMPIGTEDWHLLGDPSDLSMLERLAQAGAVALLFEQIAHRGEADPDLIRASGELGNTPPADSLAGGTAADMRDRVAAYSQNPLLWPEGSICSTGVTTGDPGNPSTTPNEIEPPPETEDDGAGADADSDDGGCSCRAGRGQTPGVPALWGLLGFLGGLGVVLRRRRRAPAKRWAH